MPGLDGLQVVSAGAQPARPIRKSANEFICRFPRPNPPNVRGQRTNSNSKPARRLCDDFVHESIIGSLFDGRVEGPARVGNHDAIVPSIAGWARQHGINTIFVDDRDPFAHGFQVS